MQLEYCELVKIFPSLSIWVETSWAGLLGIKSKSKYVHCCRAATRYVHLLTSISAWQDIHVFSIDSVQPHNIGFFNLHFIRVNSED